jgi:type III secretory pathway component EscR
MSAKPPTAKAVKQIITKFEISYNEIAALCRALAESEDELMQYLADCTHRNADRVFHDLHNLHEEIARKEKRP